MADEKKATLRNSPATEPPVPELAGDTTWIREGFRSVREEIQAVDRRLREDMRKLEARLRKDIKRLDKRLRKVETMIWVAMGAGFVIVALASFIGTVAWQAVVAALPVILGDG